MCVGGRFAVDLRKLSPFLRVGAAWGPAWARSAPGGGGAGAQGELAGLAAGLLASERL